MVSAAVVTPANSHEQGIYLTKLLTGEKLTEEFAQFGTDKLNYESPNAILGGSCSEETIVHCYGMVQDMLEPEFFHGTVNLGERTPLLMTPVTQDKQSSTNNDHRKKRQKTASEQFAAYFYYDQYDNSSSSRRKLKLNELVEVVGVWEALEVGTTSEDDDFSTTLPPMTPRLHVLWFQPVSLDTISNCSLPVMSPTTLSASGTIESAVWMLLHSKAERNQNDEPVLKPHLVGCASLNWILENSSINVVGILKQLVGASSLHVINPAACVLPQKIHGRLLPTPLQLPSGSTIVLDLRQSVVPPNKLQDLRELCSSHLLQYSFEGGVRIPFEADYRILVLSSPMSSSLLPCTMTVRSFEGPRFEHIEQLRSSLEYARQTFPKICLDTSVVEMAPQEYCARRPNAKEADLHRWLTLTKLQARSRHSKLATLDDWYAALALDDAMRATLE